METENTPKSSDGLPALNIVGTLALDDSQYSESLVFASGLPTTRNGKPCFYWDKEAIGPGTIRDAAGNVWKLTPKDIDDIVEDVGRAMSFGHEPALPDRHFGAPGKNYGWVKRIKKNSRGFIELTHQHVGAAENDAALNLKTSVLLKPNYTDERGRQWRWWLDHNAVIPKPQIRDLADYKPTALAASDGQATEAAYMILADEQPEAAPPKEIHMDLTTLRASLGEAAKDKPDDQVLALAATAITAGNDSRTKLRATLGTAAEGKPDGDLIALCADQIEANGVLALELTAAEQKVAEATEKLALSSEQVEPEMDARLKAMLSDAADQARELALSAGLTPAAAKLFDELFDDAKGKPNALALSACGASNRTTEYEMWRRIKQLVEQVDTAILKPNAPVRRNGVLGQPVEKLALGAEADTEEKPPTEERVGELLGSIGRAPVAAAK